MFQILHFCFIFNNNYSSSELDAKHKHFETRKSKEYRNVSLSDDPRFVHFNFPLFAATALFTRGARYFLLAYLFSKYGAKIQKQIDQKFSTFVIWVVGSFAIVIAGMYLFYVKFPQYFIA